MARRKKEPARIHRKNISDAANTLFISKGITDTTMDNIAKLAGYSKATLYVYFENKEEIFFSLVYKHAKWLYETIEKIIQIQPSTQEEWQKNYLKICFALQKLCENYPIYFDGMIGHINVDMTSKETPQVYRDIYQLGLDVNQLINKLIEDGVHLNYLQTELDFNQSTLFFWSALSGIIRMAENKKEYYRLLGLDNKTFLEEEFLTLLACYKKG